jgi:DNA-binding PadR family transcriptional regulator
MSATLILFFSSRVPRNLRTAFDRNNATGKECSQSVIYEHCDGCLTARRSKLNRGVSATPSHIYLQNFYILTIVEDMRKREYLGQMELMVLLAAIRPASDAYGVQICREISEKSGREVALASVYAALERLEAKGLLISSLGDPTAERGGKARTYFKATPKGLKEATNARATLLKLSTGLLLAKGEHS